MQLKKVIQQFKNRKVLLLQGPVGPFFYHFAKSLKNIENAFRRMYHTEKIKIEVSSQKTTLCNYTAGEKNSLFFTGGVDATSALVSTFSKKPLLINI